MRLARRLGVALNRIHRMDALEGLARVPDGSVDLIVTDPPWNIATLNRKTIVRGRYLSTKEAFGSWDTFHPFDYDLFMLRLISEAHRVLKQGGAMYLFTARQDNGFFIRQAVARGFTYRDQIALVKTSSVPSVFKNSWRNAFDLCVYFTKGKVRAFHFPGQAEAVNVYTYPIRHKSTTHPTEKPVEFIKRVISVSSDVGDLVLDPFMGSGTTAVAAKELGRLFLGFERERSYVAMANDRLARTLETSGEELRRS